MSPALDGGGLERGRGGTEATQPVQECDETLLVDCLYSLSWLTGLLASVGEDWAQR